MRMFDVTGKHPGQNNDKEQFTIKVWKDTTTLCREFVKFLKDNGKYLSEPFTDETDCINFVECITKNGNNFLQDINLTKLS